jgi:predicted nucleotidyltransferase
MSTDTLDPAALIEWPDMAEAERALAEFSDKVRAHYGARLSGLYLFGSRARGDQRPDSDADVAVILADGDWIEWQERRVLLNLAYEIGLDSGLYIQPWPFAAGEWAGGDAVQLVASARRDAIAIEPLP